MMKEIPYNELNFSYDEEEYDEYEKKLMCKNIENQNANIDEHSFGGRMGEARNSIMKK